MEKSENTKYLQITFIHKRVLDASLFRSYEARKQAHYTMNPVSNQKKLESPIATRAIKKASVYGNNIETKPNRLVFFPR